MRPDLSPSITAPVSISPPRLVLMSITPGFMPAMLRRSIR